MSGIRPNRNKTLIIGDVHGCAAELEQLLLLANLGPADRILCLGDLVGKGPDSVEVFKWAMQDGRVISVRGNHEHRLLELAAEGPSRRTKEEDIRTLAQLGPVLDKFIEHARRMPLLHEEEDLILVHAGIDPGRKLHQQKAKHLLTLRYLEDDKTPWFEKYRGNKLVVYGHWARPEPLHYGGTLGIDTGCVYGGKLTGLLWPDCQLLSVSAREVYKEKKDWPKRLPARLA